MIKAMLRIFLMPILMVFRLLLGTLAFLTTISSAVIGLGTSIFVIFAMVEFFIGYWQNGIALMALALLVSPIGLPTQTYRWGLLLRRRNDTVTAQITWQLRQPTWLPLFLWRKGNGNHKTDCDAYYQRE